MSNAQPQNTQNWFRRELDLIKSNVVYVGSALFVSILLAAFVVASLFYWDNSKVMLGLAAGFIVLGQGSIDFCKDHTPTDKLTLDLIKMLYILAGVVVAFFALIND